MSELEDVLAELGLSRYLHDFLEQGFDTWYTILHIKESDFDVLGVKLGYRRKLQRKLASLRGLPRIEHLMLESLMSRVSSAGAHITSHYTNT